MTYDTDHPKERVEEREHGVFVPPNEQHLREDGAPIEPPESNSDMSYDDDEAARHDADRPEAIGTEADPHTTQPTLVDTQPIDPEPATPLVFRPSFDWTVM